MGYDLSRWAQHVSHPCLMPRTRQVLAAICMVAHDEHGEFWMRGQKFLEENLPDMSYGAYRNHLSILVRNGLLLKIWHGGGPISHGNGKTTRYRINSPVVQNPHPEQTALPDIVKAPEAQPPAHEVKSEPAVSPTIKMYMRLEELLEAGITPEQMLAMLETMSANMSDKGVDLSGGVTCSPDLSGDVTGLGAETAEKVRHVSSDMSDEGVDMSGGVTCSPELSAHLTCSESQTCQVSLHVGPKHVSSPDTPSLHEEKEHEEKRDHAAAANMSDLPDDDLTGFFDILATALAAAGYSGIRATQFADLKGFLADYTNLTGSPPDQRTAAYIVGRVSETADIRNVAAFVRRLVSDVLTTGEGFVAYEPPPPAPPPEHPAEPLPPPDWAVLHLAHVEQVSPAQEVWDAALDVLRGQVSSTAYETWLSSSSGSAYADGQFVVGSANAFASEMLRNRMHPLIESAVNGVTGVKLRIQYAVAPVEGRGECPVCQGAEEARIEAS